MRKLESIEDEMQGRSTYLLDDGRYIQLYLADIREHGIAALLRAHGVEPNNDPVPVTQNGKVIGTVPGTFEPIAIKSTSFFYEPRPGDFKRTSDGWEASRQLGPGDLHAVPGFVWGDPKQKQEMDAISDDWNSALKQVLAGDRVNGTDRS